MSQPNPSFKNNFAQADRDFAVTCYKAALDFCEKNELLSESDFKALIAANIESSGIANDFPAICVNIRSTVKSLPRKGNFTIQVYKNFARKAMLETGSMPYHCEEGYGMRNCGARRSSFQEVVSNFKCFGLSVQDALEMKAGDQKLFRTSYMRYEITRLK